MILEIVENDRPKSLGEKLAEYLARPPQPILRFYGAFSAEISDGKRHVLFAIRNGLPLPLLYGIYIRAKYDSAVDYRELTDHIGPFSVDNFRLTLDTIEPVVVEIVVGIVPFEITTDRTEISITN